MKKVLVVDDTKNIRLLLQKTLELEGFYVETASTGTEALTTIRTYSFDLIFLDIKLPEISGTEVLKKIRSDGINTPVIIITAYPTVKNAVDCVQLGAITYLQKPFTSERLKNILKQFNLSSNSPTQDVPITLLQEIKEAFKCSEYQKAIRLLSALLSENPMDAKVYELLSKAYKNIGDDESSEKFLKAYKIFK